MDAYASSFVTQYYAMMDTNRDMLRGLYRQGSMLSFEGQQFMHPDSIMGKLTAIPKNTKHKITRMDVQATSSGVLIFVLGLLSIDDDNPLPYSEAFHLQPIPEQQGAAYILNDVFRFALST
eukprot:TRINITY_DN4952_c0_g1_i2.p1 TRINITY_DN4952_c0_g1~~TRINITY_DN4952_c0_g1_i2.p1  ORF type:complete len:121 (-),score=3.70 TRINITY_DN4952_c0_g1_i2:111-473(-)